jgi:hypothetical protein
MNNRGALHSVVLGVERDFAADPAEGDAFQGCFRGGDIVLAGGLDCLQQQVRGVVRKTGDDVRRSGRSVLQVVRLLEALNFRAWICRPIVIGEVAAVVFVFLAFRLLRFLLKSKFGKGNDLFTYSGCRFMLLGGNLKIVTACAVSNYEFAKVEKSDKSPV